MQSLSKQLPQFQTRVSRTAHEPVVLDQILLKMYQWTEPQTFPAFCLQSILGILEASAGSFFLWDEFRKEFILKAAQGRFSEKIADARVKLHEGILGWVGSQGNSILVEDIHTDTRFQAISRLGHYKSQSFISIPILIENQLLGVINVTERANLVPFSEEDLLQAQNFSKHIATAFANLKNQERLRRENEDFFNQITKLRTSQKDNELYTDIGKLTANLAHELNNPLDSIRRYVNLALEESLQNSLTKDYLFRAKKGIRRAIGVVRNLLDYASVNKSKKRFVEIHELIEKSLEITEDPQFRKIEVKKAFNAIPAYVLDRGLAMVFYNLYQNACQAMKGAGTITLSTQRVQKTILISVEDSGTGIASAIRPHLFEPFVTSKNSGEGNGIGLALCKEIVERSGGSIACDETLLRGTRFLITLPCHEKGDE